MQFQRSFGEKMSELGIIKLSTIDDTLSLRVARKIKVKIEKNNQRML